MTKYLYKSGIDEISIICPRCNKTALWQRKSGNYYCDACGAAIKDQKKDEE